MKVSREAHPRLKMEKRSRSYVAVEGHILNIPLELNGGKSKTY
jgi:hypothetical protein